jgi:trigger factor
LKTEVTEAGKNKVKLTIEVPSADIEKVLSRTYKRLAADVRVPGFRPGKAPRAVIDQRLGKDFVRSEVLKDILPDLYAEAVRSEDVDVVAPPSIEVTSFEEGKDLTFEATVETRPEPVLKDYTGLAGTKPEVAITDADVDEQVEHLRNRFATLEVIERPLQNGDFAQIDLTTTHHDSTIDELTTKDFLIEVGAEMVVPELDTELLGKVKGDILKVNTTLSERFGDRAGWQVSMTILVKEAKTRKLPALDDEFAKTVSEFDTLDELKGDIRKRIEDGTEQRATAALRESVLDSFVESGVEVELPDGMVDVEVDGLVTSFAQMLAAQGIPVDRYMESQNLDVDALRNQFREQAEKNLTMRLGLDAVAQTEGLQVTDEERDSEVERLAARSGRDVEEVKQLLARQEAGEKAGMSIDGDILRAKALDLLVERAAVTTKPADELAPEQEGEEGTQ